MASSHPLVPGDKDDESERRKSVEKVASHPLVPGDKDDESERRKSVEKVAGEVVRNVIEMSLETLASQRADQSTASVNQGKGGPDETNQDLIIQYVSCETETDPWKVSVSTQTAKFFQGKDSAKFFQGKDSVNFFQGKDSKRKHPCFDTSMKDTFRRNEKDLKKQLSLRYHDDYSDDSCYSSSDSELDDDLLLECESMIISTNLAISTGLMALITGEMALNSEDLALEVGETALETGRIALECARLRSSVEQETLKFSELTVEFRTVVSEGRRQNYSSDLFTK